MLPYIIRRLLFLFVVLFGVSVLIFGILMSFSPERRAAAYVTTPQQAKDIPKIIKQFGLDDPFYVQYVRWMKEVFKGNLGWSLVASSPVMDAFLRYIPITIELQIYGLPIIVLLGIWLGSQAGIRKDTAFDHTSRVLAIVGWSLPTFLLALVLLMIFYGYFNWFQPGEISDQLLLTVINNPDLYRKVTGLYTIDGLLNGRLDVTLNAFKHLVLPITTEVIVIVAGLMRVMRSGMIEELSKDYVMTAMAKGADQHTIHFVHAQKNAIIPVVTLAGQLAAYLLEGSVSVEYIFNRKGMGWWMASSATQLDMPVLMAMCLFFGLVFTTFNLIIDILYAYIDPRIRLS